MPNTFTLQGFTVTGAIDAVNNTGTLNLNDLSVTGATNVGINVVNHAGDINLTDVNSSGNVTYGAWLNNTAGTGSVTLSGTNVFSDNKGSSGLFVFSNGDVSASNVTASGNSNIGAYLNSPTGVITLNGTKNVFSGNITGLQVGARNVTLNNATLNNSTTNIQNNVGSSYTLTLNCVTFSGNGTNISKTSNVVDNGCGSATVNSPVVPLVTVVSAVPLPAVEDEKGRTTVQSTSLYTVLEQTQEQLPAELEAGTFGSALKVALTDQGANVTDLVIKLSFPIPASMKDANLAVMFWNGSAWVEVSGGSVVDGSFVITVSQPGTYVLIAK